MRTQLKGWIRGMQSALETATLGIRKSEERVYSFAGPVRFSSRTISYHAG